MKKNNEVTEPVTQTKTTKPETPKSDYFDGVWEITEPIGPNQYQTVQRKIWLNSDEQKKWFGEHDPKVYFRDGVIPNYAPKSFGDLLPEDRMEVQELRKHLALYPDVLMFKHQLQNIYTLLIPKSVSEHELDQQGDFENRLVRYDTRSIAFTGGFGRPSSFEADFFYAQLSKIKKHLDKAKLERGV